MAKNLVEKLTTMSAVEKRFMRRFVESRLAPSGIAKKQWPELKADALGRFRRAQKVKCATMACEAVAEIFGEEIAKKTGDWDMKM